MKQYFTYGDRSDTFFLPFWYFLQRRCNVESYVQRFHQRRHLKIKNKFTFLKSFWRTHTLFWGHWYLCFGFLVTSPLIFKARVGSVYSLFCRDECNVHSLRPTSGATPANLLMAGIPIGYFPTCISRGGSWLRFEQAITRSEDEDSTIVPVTWLFNNNKST